MLAFYLIRFYFYSTSYNINYLQGLYRGRKLQPEPAGKQSGKKKPWARPNLQGGNNLLNYTWVKEEEKREMGQTE